MINFSEAFLDGLDKALYFAKSEEAMSITPAHIILGLLESRDRDTLRLLETASIDVDRLRQRMIAMIESGSQNTFLPAGNIQNQANGMVYRLSKVATVACQSILKIMEDKKIGRDFTGADFLAGVVLATGNLPLANNIVGTNDPSLFMDAWKLWNDTVARPSAPPSLPIKSMPHLTDVEFTENMVRTAAQKIKDGTDHPVIGRDAEIDRVIEVLGRKTKNNPIILGEAGVGKTAIIEGLAQRIAEGKVPDYLKDMQIFAVDLPGMIAGTKYRGMAEERIKNVVSRVKSIKNAILFIDEIHNLVGAGSAEGAMDYANILKQPLARGELPCIGATTYAEYRKTIEKDAALDRRFQGVFIDELSIPASIKVMERLAPSLEKHHGVKIDHSALVSSVKKGKRHLHKRKLPDVAIDIIDETCAVAKLKGQARIGVEDTDRTVAKMAKAPLDAVNDTDKEKLKNIKTELDKIVIDQEEATAKVASAVKIHRMGLNEPGKPIATFLFLGPTGTGKSALAKALGEKMGMPVIRYDMSEYMEKANASRLLGASPSFIGYEEGGQLINAINEKPYCILLLDEIEKAHLDIHKLLLQITEESEITGGNGKKARFDNVIIIMTSNAGAADMMKTGMGFGDQTVSSSQQESIGKKALEKLLPPELIGRIGDNGIVVFKPLQPKTVSEIEKKFVKELEELLAPRGIKLELDNKAHEWLIKNGYNIKYGARPMKDLIKKTMKTELAEQMVEDGIEDGSTVKVSVAKDKLTFTVAAKEKRSPLVAAASPEAANAPARPKRQRKVDAAWDSESPAP